jgi:hypothetical protein
MRPAGGFVPLTQCEVPQDTLTPSATQVLEALARCAFLTDLLTLDVDCLIEDLAALLQDLKVHVSYWAPPSREEAVFIGTEQAKTYTNK